MCLHVFVLSHFSRLFVTLWTVTRLLSTGLSRQECWGGLPCPPPGVLPDPGIETAPPVATALQADSLPLSYWEAPIHAYCMPDPESGSGGVKTVRRHAVCSCSGCTLHNPKGQRIV